jgi:hypothetical protein
MRIIELSNLVVWIYVLKSQLLYGVMTWHRVSADPSVNCRRSSSLVNAGRAGVMRNRSHHFEWPCWAACQKERERERFELWETMSNLGHGENVDKNRDIWPCVHSWYKPMTTNNKKKDPKRSTMAKWPSSGVHRRFRVKPSTSTESVASKKLKCDLSIQNSQIWAYFSNIWSSVLKSVYAHAHSLKASSPSLQLVTTTTTINNNIRLTGYRLTRVLHVYTY